MKAAINSLPLSGGHASRGVGFYTKNLIENLKQIKDIELYEFSCLDELSDVDLVHYPFFDLFFPTLPFNKKFSTVVTIHDVTPLLFSKAYPPGIKGSISYWLQRFSLKNVAGVITDSLNSKKDINERLGVPLEKIFVTHLGVDARFRVIEDKEKLNKLQKKFNLPEEFALFVGSVNWNKNICTIADACLKAGMPVVFIGKSFTEYSDIDHPEMKSFKTFLKLYGENENIIRLGFVEQEELVCLYNLSLLLVFPSIYEGFGLPILEAQACGVPVVTSNTSSLPEVAGEGAVLVNPENVEDVAKAISELQSNAALREELKLKGFRNAKKFTWGKTALATADVYRSVVKHD